MELGAAEFMKSMLAFYRRLGVSSWLPGILGNEMAKFSPTRIAFARKGDKAQRSYMNSRKGLPDLYDIERRHISYYPPKGDAKEAGLIQLFGWMGYEMEVKLNFNVAIRFRSAVATGSDTTHRLRKSLREHGIVEWQLILDTRSTLWEPTQLRANTCTRGTSANGGSLVRSPIPRFLPSKK